MLTADEIPVAHTPDGGWRGRCPAGARPLHGPLHRMSRPEGLWKARLVESEGRAWPSMR
jgi:hypothetical protein